MAKCGHPNVEILEEAMTFSCWTIRGKVIEDASQLGGNYTGIISVKCLDCGLQKRYTWSRRPAWVHRHMDTIADYAGKD